MSRIPTPDGVSIPRRANDALSAERLAAEELRAHWDDFCDCDCFPTYDGFVERMEVAGLVEWRRVDDDDLEQSFADEKGIEPGGMIYDLTAKGLAVYLDRSANSASQGPSGYEGSPEPECAQPSQSPDRKGE